MRGVNAKFGPRCFFCNLEGHFNSDCPQFWDAVADIKHPRHEEALSGVKASKARLLSEAEARRKDKPQELAAKKMQAVTEKARERRNQQRRLTTSRLIIRQPQGML